LTPARVRGGVVDARGRHDVVEVREPREEIVCVNAGFPNSAYGLEKQRKELDNEFHEPCDAMGSEAGSVKTYKVWLRTISFQGI